MELDYTASAKCRFGISHHSMVNPKKVHLLKIVISWTFCTKSLDRLQRFAELAFSPALPPFMNFMQQLHH
jgi:hypothetical protein